MQRVKNVSYNEDDIYSDEDFAEDQEFTNEDRENFASLTPVVQAGLEEHGLQASRQEIEEALWHYYWDVAKSVSYLVNQKKPRQQKQETKVKNSKTKFDEAAERGANKSGKFVQSPCLFTLP